MSDQLISRFALKVKLNKFEHQAVFIQALLCEILNKLGGATTHKLVQGYCTLHGQSCQHFWIEGPQQEPIDITRKLFKQFDVPDLILSKDPIAGAEKDQFTTDLFEVYESCDANKKEFWKKAPKKFLDFRSKCHGQISKTSHL